MERFLYNNTVLRILALVLACAIWLGVNAPSGSQAANGGLSQPFSYLVKVETAPGIVATAISPSFVNVLLGGNNASLSTIQSDMARVAVVADAVNLAPGSHVVKLQLLNMPSVPHTLTPTVVTVVLQRVQGP